MDSGSTEGIRRQAEEMAAAAEREPLMYLTYHEERRLYDDDGCFEEDRRSTQELESAVARGDLDAMVTLGMRREREGDVDGAMDVYGDAAALGSACAQFRLGFAVEVHGRDPEEALRCYLDADAAGDANGAGNAARLLQARGDLLAAEEAYGRCYRRGGLRALSDHAGLMSNRSDVTADEIRDVVVELCAIEDIWVEAEVGERSGDKEDGREEASRQAGPSLAVFSGMWGRCDGGAMEAGVIAADQRGSASGSYHLGIVLRERGDWEGSARASTRAGERGYPAGWTNAALGFKQIGNVVAAERAALKGDALGEADATVLLGLILDEKGDRHGSIEANRKADAMGHKDGSFHLGIDLVKEGQMEEAEAALRRALERGEPKAAEILQMLESRRG